METIFSKVSSSANIQTTASSTKSLASDELCLTFSILCKIFLPRDKLDQLTAVIVQVAKGTTSCTSAFAQISRILSFSPQLSNIWMVMTEKNANIDCPQFTLINSVVRAFESQDVPRAVLFSFFEIICQCSSGRISKLELLCRIMKLCTSSYLPISASSIMSFSLNLLKYMPTIYEPSFYNEESEKLKETIWEYNPVHNNDSPPVIKPYKITPREPRGAHEIHQKFGVSYKKLTVPQVSGAAMFYINCNAHSYQQGSEGDSHSSANETFIRQLTMFMYNQFERLVLADIALYAALDQGKTNGILFRTNLKALYGDSNWPTVALMLRNQLPCPVLSNRIQSTLVDLTDYKFDTVERVKALLRHYPTFDFGSFMHFEKPVRFPFHQTSFMSSALLDHIATVDNGAMQWFFESVMPLFSFESIYEESIAIIGNNALANALYYYSKVASAIKELFSADRSDEQSMLSLCEAAATEVELKYLHPMKASFTDFITVFASSYTGIEDISHQIEEAEQRFGNKSKYFFEMMMYLTRVSATASRLMLDSTWTKIETFARAYGRMSGTGSSERLKALRPFYLSKAKQVMHCHLVLIELNHSTEMLNFTPL